MCYQEQIRGVCFPELAKGQIARIAFNMKGVYPSVYTPYLNKLHVIAMMVQALSVSLFLKVI
jgi:hypothetical protein